MNTAQRSDPRRPSGTTRIQWIRPSPTEQVNPVTPRRTNTGTARRFRPAGLYRPEPGRACFGDGAGLDATILSGLASKAKFLSRIGSSEECRMGVKKCRIVHSMRPCPGRTAFSPPAPEPPCVRRAGMASISPEPCLECGVFRDASLFTRSGARGRRRSGRGGFRAVRVSFPGRFPPVPDSA